MSLKIEFDRDALRPLVQLAVAEALGRLEAERAKLNGRLAFTEPEAAVLLGVKAHVLRDCRRRRLLGQVGRVLGERSDNG
jgi:HEAT repeat protein